MNNNFSQYCEKRTHQVAFIVLRFSPKCDGIWIKTSILSIYLLLNLLLRHSFTLYLHMTKIYRQ